MSLLSKLAPHLPFVRRYARALTGQQSLGDDFVRQTLRRLAAGDSALDETVSPRVGLYKLFQSNWGDAGATSGVAPPTTLGSTPLGPTFAGDATGHVLRIAPASRQAFLLTAMEGFAVSEAATIMGVDFETIESLIVTAQRDIDAELATDVLIIEDEPVIAADIQALVEELGHTVTGVATTRTEAKTLASGHKPGLVLADIQLADGSSGIDAVKDILAEADVPVIFITAFPERLLTGDRPEPAFLITKPFDPATVKAAMGQALFFHPRRDEE
jgi:CheY-like chemotaxis protein